MTKKKTKLSEILKTMNTEEIKLFAQMDWKQRERFKLLRATKII